MKPTEQEKTKPVWIPESVHRAVKIRAAIEGVSLQDLATEKLKELMPEEATQPA